jgi:hypothetical protein
MPLPELPELAPFEPKPFVPKPFKASIEMHLLPDSDLPKVYGKKIKRLKGHYSAARGHASTRFVHLPATEEGVTLAQELVDGYGKAYGRDEKRRRKTTVILHANARLSPSESVRYVGDGKDCQFPTVAAMVERTTGLARGKHKAEEAERQKRHEADEARRRARYDLDVNSRVLMARLTDEGRHIDAQTVYKLRAAQWGGMNG